MEGKHRRRVPGIFLTKATLDINVRLGASLVKGPFKKVCYSPWGEGLAKKIIKCNLGRRGLSQFVSCNSTTLCTFKCNCPYRV